MDFFVPSKLRQSKKSKHRCINDQLPYPNQDQDTKLQSGTSSILQSPKSGLRGHGCTMNLQTENRTKILNMGVLKTSDHIQIKIKMPNPNQEPPASSKAPNQDLKDMDVLGTFKIKIENKTLEYWYIKDH